MRRKPGASMNLRRSVALVVCSSALALPIAGCSASADDSDIGSDTSAIDAAIQHDDTDTCPLNNWYDDDGEFPNQTFRAGDADYIDPYLYAAGCHDRRVYQDADSNIFFAALCPNAQLAAGGKLNNEINNVKLTGIDTYTVRIQDPHPAIMPPGPGVHSKAYYGVALKTSVCQDAAPAGEHWLAWNAYTQLQRVEWCGANKNQVCASKTIHPSPTCSTCSVNGVQVTKITNLYKPTL
jgi:hypothetical protein